MFSLVFFAVEYIFLDIRSFLFLLLLKNLNFPLHNSGFKYSMLTRLANKPSDWFTAVIRPTTAAQGHNYNFPILREFHSYNIEPSPATVT